MPSRAPKYSIILAAGKGTRMQSAAMAKVCFPVDGIPAINRAIETYNACGIQHHIVVVGALAGQVVETVGKAFSNVSFVFQSEQKGTAHAVKKALEALSIFEEDSELLLVPGDRIIESTVIEQMFDLFYSSKSELTLLATPHLPASSQGRLLESPSGELLAIVEAADIRQRRTYARLLSPDTLGSLTTREAFLSFLRSGFSHKGEIPGDAKLEKAFDRVWHTLSTENRLPSRAELSTWITPDMTRFHVNDHKGNTHYFSPDEADKASWVNNSVYLIRKKSLEASLKSLSRANAQHEEYLTDMVAALQHSTTTPPATAPCSVLRVKNADQILGFNDPAELLQIETAIRTRHAKAGADGPPLSTWYRPVREWAAIFKELLENKSENPAAFLNEFKILYDVDDAVLQERFKAYSALVSNAAVKLGDDKPVFIIRSPGRVNVMGRHIDHQGGHCNLMTIGYETLMAVHVRTDDAVNLFSSDPAKFQDRTFTIGSLVSDLPWEDWLSVVNSAKVAAMAKTYGGDWSQYIKAAILRLQKKYSHIRLKGMDMVVAGNIPMAAGLSSSSTLVVGTAEAAIAANSLDTFPSQLVDLCGEGEWFVGTRGGSADHAAVKMGQKGRVIRVTFFDFAMEASVPFPETHVLAVCDSGISANKTTNAKDQFNHRIACYHIGFALIKKAFPQYAPLLKKLRDVNTRRLGIPLSWIYRILLHLPEQATREELRTLLPDDDLTVLFASHQTPADGLYPVRGVVLFGLAECERARNYTPLLKAGRLDDIGRLMNTSHNGDRVSSFNGKGEQIPYRAPSSNLHLLGLLEDLESGDPDRVIAAQLQQQPGDYHCSCPEIDRMVDIALQVPGVEGAQLAGAGLGGCMMVLLKKEAVPDLGSKLQDGYYGPAGKAPNILICRPIAGSGVLLKEQDYLKSR